MEVRQTNRQINGETDERKYIQAERQADGHIRTEGAEALYFSTLLSEDGI